MKKLILVLTVLVMVLGCGGVQPPIPNAQPEIVREPATPACWVFRPETKNAPNWIDDTTAHDDVDGGLAFTTSFRAKGDYRSHPDLVDSRLALLSGEKACRYLTNEVRSILKNQNISLDTAIRDEFEKVTGNKCRGNVPGLRREALYEDGSCLVHARYKASGKQVRRWFIDSGVSQSAVEAYLRLKRGRAGR